MGVFLGIDTSNYTTSCALFDTADLSFTQQKRLLPVKEGERGLRQSDAVFHHTKQLPELMEALLSGAPVPEAIGVSTAPRLAEGSYMPCFLVGSGTARSIGAAMNVPVFTTSHQMGHILAALYSAGKLELLWGNDPFIAFHVSGGTTDMLLCTPDKKRLLDIREVGGSSDLKAGQCIDRVGVRLGLRFPCGPELERLADGCDEKLPRARISVRDMYCSLSGIENQCDKLLKEGRSKEAVARFCLESVYSAIRELSQAAVESFGKLPIIYAGGVMSNRTMKERLTQEFNGAFAEPALSSDNAVGTAIYAACCKGELL